MMHLQSRHSGKEIVDFIRKYGKKCFKGWTDEGILSEILAAERCNGLGIVSDNGKISGIAVGLVKGAKEFHVCHIETLRHRDVQILIRIFLERFPGWQITANRSGKFIRYNTAKLLRKLYGRTTRD